GDPQQEESNQETKGVQDPEVFLQRPEPGRERHSENWKQVDEPDPCQCDGDLSNCIDTNRVVETIPIPRSQGVAKSKPAHETGEDKAGCPNAVTKRQSCLAKPERFEDERGGP